MYAKRETLLSSKCTCASYLDLHIKIDSECRLRTTLYNKRNYFDFPIVIFHLYLVTFQKHLHMEYICKTQIDVQSLTYASNDVTPVRAGFWSNDGEVTRPDSRWVILDDKTCLCFWGFFKFFYSYCRSNLIALIWTLLTVIWQIIESTYDFDNNYIDDIKEWENAKTINTKKS